MSLYESARADELAPGDIIRYHDALAEVLAADARGGAAVYLTTTAGYQWVVPEREFARLADRSRLAEAIDRDRDRRRYLSSAELAEAVGVSRSTITASLRRHGPLSARPFPEPDVWIGTAPGWRRGRVAEVRAWFAERRRGRARSRVEELQRAEEV